MILKGPSLFSSGRLHISELETKLSFETALCVCPGRDDMESYGINLIMTYKSGKIRINTIKIDIKVKSVYIQVRGDVYETQNIIPFDWVEEQGIRPDAVASVWGKTGGQDLSSA